MRSDDSARVEAFDSGELRTASMGQRGQGRPGRWMGNLGIKTAGLGSGSLSTLIRDSRVFLAPAFREAVRCRLSFCGSQASQEAHHLNSLTMGGLVTGLAIALSGYQQQQQYHNPDADIPFSLPVFVPCRDAPCFAPPPTTNNHDTSDLRSPRAVPCFACWASCSLPASACCAYSYVITSLSRSGCPCVCVCAQSGSSERGNVESISTGPIGPVA